ncbi:MAG: hypothetical protein EXS05_12120 [Planctomycetaceae bacterium]|nr:hypothetical protein [Planctomycetaceae bacterium]
MQPNISKPHRQLAFALRCLGVLDLSALIVVALPNWIFTDLISGLGLGDSPARSLDVYLAKTTSALYAVHGALIINLSYDVSRYWKLIRFLAFAALVHGLVILGIDSTLDLPAWWRYIEGPGFAATGALILWLQQQVANGERDGAPSQRTTSSRDQ